MTPKLTAEQREAILNAAGPVLVEDEQAHQFYYLVDRATLDTLRQQEDIAAIQEGLDDFAAGRVSPADEVIERIRTKLGLPPRQK